MTSSAYELNAWHDFLITSAGAAAALAGLIFVAVSINLRDILDEEKKLGSTYLTGRALESLFALLVVLGISMIGLDPSLPRGVFAALLFVSAVGSGVSPVLSARAYRESHVKPIGYSLRRVLAVLLVIAYAAAGVTFVAKHGGGMHWLPFAFVLAITIAATNAWVLLVEVLR